MFWCFLLHLLLNFSLQLPKATDTGAFSTAGLMRLVKNVGDSISKIAGKKGDPDGVSNCCVFSCTKTELRLYTSFVLLSLSKDKKST